MCIVCVSHYFIAVANVIHELPQPVRWPVSFIPVPSVVCVVCVDQVMSCLSYCPGEHHYHHQPLLCSSGHLVVCAVV